MLEVMYEFVCVPPHSLTVKLPKFIVYMYM